MKPYILFLFIILASCNDGGSDPEFVEAKGDTAIIIAHDKPSGWVVRGHEDSIKNIGGYQGFYSGDSNHPYPSLKHLSRKKNKLSANDTVLKSTGRASVFYISPRDIIKSPYAVNYPNVNPAYDTILMKGEIKNMVQKKKENKRDSGQIFFWGTGKWDELKRIEGNYVPGVIDSVQSLWYGNIRRDTPIKIIGYH